MFDPGDGSTYAQGHADFYSWDGSFLRTVSTSGPVYVSHDGQFYVVVSSGELWRTTGGLIAAIPDLRSIGYSWAADSDYLCGSGRNSSGGYDLVTMDTAGLVQRFTLSSPGDLHNLFGCSPKTNQAAILEGGYSSFTMSIVSLTDGHVETTTKLGPLMNAVSVSSDIHWLAELITSPDGPVESDIIDLTDGTVHAKLPGVYVAAFTPDAKNLLVSDALGTETSIFDWQTKTKLWSVTGFIERVAAASDPATNKVLLQVATGSAAAGTNVSSYWIVDGSGSASPFVPRSCGANASATRC